MWIWKLYWYDTIGDIQFLIIVPWGVVSPYMKHFTEGLLWSTVLQQFCHSRIFTVGAWMGQGCECSPPTTVAQVWFLDLVFIVGTCPCSKEKNNFPNSNFTWKQRKRSATLVEYLLHNLHYYYHYYSKSTLFCCRNADAAISALHKPSVSIADSEMLR